MKPTVGLLVGLTKWRGDVNFESKHNAAPWRVWHLDNRRMLHLSWMHWRIPKYWTDQNQTENCSKQLNIGKLNTSVRLWGTVNNTCYNFYCKKKLRNSGESNVEKYHKWKISNSGQAFVARMYSVDRGAFSKMIVNVLATRDRTWYVKKEKKIIVYDRNL